MAAVEPLTDSPDKDVSDWLQSGHDISELLTIVANTPLWVPSTAPKKFNQTDCGNAERLGYRHGMNIRHCHEIKSWFVWDGRRWQKDKTGEIIRLAKESVRAMPEELCTMLEEERGPFRRFMSKSESESRIKAMVTLAASEPGIAVRGSAFDRDPMLLNCANGTIDLRTGQLRPHSRADLITKLSPAPYHPDAQDEGWDKFIHDASRGDAALQTFLRRAAGYSLAGQIWEEVLFLLVGPAATGKTTLLEAIKCTLGDYAMTANFEAFLSRRWGGGIRNDIARLAGARFVAASEADEGEKFAHALVKLLTGGDTITARMLYENEFEYRPTFKLWVAANYAPKLRADDDAMWRRIVRVPFTNVIEKRDRDPHVKAHLCDASKARSAILAWMVRGCLDWQENGLRVPQIVQDVTAEYRESQNPLKDFVSECCMLESSAWVSTSDLRSKYERWAKGGQREFLRGNSFSESLKAYDLAPKKSGNVRGWQGIRLR